MPTIIYSGWKPQRAISAADAIRRENGIHYAEEAVTIFIDKFYYSAYPARCRLIGLKRLAMREYYVNGGSLSFIITLMK